MCCLHLLQPSHVDLTSERRSAPRLVIVSDSGEAKEVYVLADGLHLSVSCDIMGIPSGLCTMLYGIIACYYAWDLSYPKQYQVLAFIQENMFDRREKLFKGISLMKFEKQFKQL